MHRKVRHFPSRAATVAVVTLGLASLIASAPANAAGSTVTRNAAACAVNWGSTPEHLDGASPYWITDARAGRHACFDRFVVDVATPDITPDTGYQVRYVDQVHKIGGDFGGEFPPGADELGPVVPLRGGARLEILVHSPAYGEDGYTFRDRNAHELVDVSGYRTFRQVAYAGTYRTDAMFGLGVRARLPFRAFMLPGTPSRVVVDVAHQW
jgi:hypothetical protein